MQKIFSLLSAVGILFAAACSSEPSTPRIKYPVTYQVQVGNTQVKSDYGPQNMNTQAVQDVAVEVGKPIYYQVSSPFDVTVQVSEIPSSTEKRQVSQMQGKTFTATLIPQTSTIEFAFTATHANSGGALQFTLSDQPIAP